MKFTLDHIKDVVVILINEDNIISRETDIILEEFKNQIQLGFLSFVINLKNIKHIDSSGINFLISALTVIRNAEGELVLTSVPNKIENLLIVTKLNSIFNVKNSVKESVHFLKSTNGVETN